MIGNLDSTWSPSVDEKGRVQVGAPWRLDWWVGADDRWHVPGREIAVRQHAVDDTPVLGTAMRIPGGDAVQRVYAARVAGGGEVVVVEVENRSAVPVALALVVEAARRLEQEEAGLRIDGAPGLLWPKPPSRATADLDSVTSGDAGTSIVRVKDRRGRAAAAFIWPLAHRTTLRFVLPAPGAEVASAPPSAEQVVRGWKVHGERGLRLVLPDAPAQSAFDAGKLRALLEHTRSASPALAGTLDRLGFAEEAGDVLRRLDEDEALVSALAFHCRLHGDAELAAELAPAVAAVAERRRSPAVADAAAVVLRCAGEERGAADAERLAGGFVPPPPDLGGDTTSVSVLRDRLVVEDGEGGLALCSRWPSAWLGAGLEVHDAPTAHGRLSFAVRWHGDRPALLWELEGSARLTAPGLDPAWSTTEPRGDALLAPVPLPGTPVTLRRA